MSNEYDCDNCEKQADWIDYVVMWLAASVIFGLGIVVGMGL